MRTRNAFKYDKDAASLAGGLACPPGSGRTQQQFRDECDINTITKRFGLGYEIPTGLRMPQYGDFSHISDFHQALNAVAESRETFELLPAHIRDHFQNDPGRFVDFALDAKNKEQMTTWGLIKPSETTDRNQATLPVTPPSQTPPAAPAVPSAG